MLFEAALLLPEAGDARTVLPTVETRQVLLDFQGTQGNPGAQPRIVSSIHLTPGFHRSQRMTLTTGDDHLLWVAAGQGMPQPWLRQLPEQGALAAILAVDGSRNQQTTEHSLIRHVLQLPDQALTVGVAGEQPVTGRPHRLPFGVTEALQQLHVQLGATIEPQGEQRLPFQAEALAALRFISGKTTAGRQVQGSQVIQIGHGGGLTIIVDSSTR
ncbi:hypothetical protein D3C81_1188290 [compost metagenome]